MDNYNLEKSVWSDSDFAEMGWHDTTLWSTAANPDAYEFLIDLDYIFKWVDPAVGETYYKFWVAPATMIFENANAVQFDIESNLGAIEVADLHRGEPMPTPNGKLTERTYQFECQEGEIKLLATGFKMIVRQRPILLNSQRLTFEARGGVSFARVACVI
jgi:hypothetical protein